MHGHPAGSGLPDGHETYFGLARIPLERNVFYGEFQFLEVDITTSLNVFHDRFSNGLRGVDVFPLATDERCRSERDRQDTEQKTGGHYPIIPATLRLLPLNGSLALATLVCLSRE